MSQFWYSTTHDEWWPLLEAVLKQHPVRFAIDWWYPEPRCDSYDHLTAELKQRIFETRRSIFIVGDAFSHKPLFLKQQPAGPRAGEYSINLSRGGPWMRMNIPAQFEGNGLTWFGEGRLGIQDLYWNDSLTQAYPAPVELKVAFAAIRRTLQEHLFEKTVQGQKKWLSPGVWALYESGKAGFGVAGKCYTIHGEVPPPTPWRKKPIIRGEKST